MGAVAEPFPIVMVTRLLGVVDEDAPVLKEQGYASVELISGFVADEDLPALQEGVLALGRAIEAFTAACASPQPDPSTVAGLCAAAFAAGDLYRRVVTDTSLGGVTLPAGSRLVLVWPAANRAADLGDRRHRRRSAHSAPARRARSGTAPLHRCAAGPDALQQLLTRTRESALEPGAEVRNTAASWCAARSRRRSAQ
jgi:hypothetical protein